MELKWQIREYNENTMEDPQLYQWNIPSYVGQIYGHISQDDIFLIVIQYRVPVYG